MTYRIFLNDAVDEQGRSRSMWDGYRPGDPLRLVYEGESKHAALDLIWQAFNRGAPGFIGDDIYPHRSLSVGDVVEIEGTRWAVAPIGWTEIPVSDMDVQGNHHDFSDPERLVDPEIRADETYEIRRFYRDDRPHDVIVRGLTLAQAQAHCQREDTHGDDWFDGFSEEVS